jgi:hypothetical protein
VKVKLLPLKACCCPFKDSVTLPALPCNVPLIEKLDGSGLEDDDEEEELEVDDDDELEGLLLPSPEELPPLLHPASQENIITTQTFCTPANVRPTYPAITYTPNDFLMENIDWRTKAACVMCAFQRPIKTGKKKH